PPQTPHHGRNAAVRSAVPWSVMNHTQACHYGSWAVAAPALAWASISGRPLARGLTGEFRMLFFGSALAARATDASFDCVRLREHDHKPRRLLASAYASSQLRTLQIKAAQDVPDDLQGFPSGRCISGGGAQSCDEGVLELQASLGLSDLGVVEMQLLAQF